MAKRKLKSLAATTAITLAAVGTPALADEVTPTVNASNESIVKTDPSTGATTEPHKVTSDEVKNDVDAQKQNVATAQSQVNNATANATAADQAQAKAQAEADAANQAVKNAEANAAKATPKNIAANQADQAANLADQKANAKETEQVNAEITNQTNKVTNAQTAVNTAQSEKDAADANVTAKDTDVKSAQAAIDGTGQAKAQENLAKAKGDTKAAEANVATATQAVDTAKKADADRNAKVKTAETDVKVKSDAVTNAANRVTAAQNAVKSTTDKLTEATTAVQKAQKALDNADKVTIPKLDQFKADKASGDSDAITDSGATAIENSSTKIGEDDKSDIVEIGNLTAKQREKLSLYAAQVLTEIRKKLGLSKITVTDAAMNSAKKQGSKYVARGTSVAQDGHISGDYIGENISTAYTTSKTMTMYELKQLMYNAIMSQTFADAPSKWGHLNNNLKGNHIGIDVVTINNQLHLISVIQTAGGTEIVNTEDITKLEANLAQAKATQAEAQTASDAAKVELTKASADYAAALDLKTQAEKVLANAQATPLQTQVAENNLLLAKIALQNAQEREVAAQKALDNFTADLATKKAKLEEAKAALATAKTNAETKATALETAKAELVKQQAKLNSLNKEKVALLAEKDRLVAEAKALATELKGYLKAPAILAAAQATASEKDSALKDAMTKAKAAHTKLKELQAKLAEEQTKLAELQTKYDRLKDLEDKAKDNKIITLPDGTIVAVPKVAPTAEKLPEFDPSKLVKKPVEKPKEQKGDGNTTVNSVSGTSPAGITVTQTASGEKVTYSRVACAKALPQTGEQESLLAVFGVAILSILGLTGARRKRRG